MCNDRFSKILQLIFIFLLTANLLVSFLNNKSISGVEAGNSILTYEVYAASDAEIADTINQQVKKGWRFKQVLPRHARGTMGYLIIFER